MPDTQTKLTDDSGGPAHAEIEQPIGTALAWRFNLPRAELAVFQLGSELLEEARGIAEKHNLTPEQLFSAVTTIAAGRNVLGAGELKVAYPANPITQLGSEPFMAVNLSDDFRHNEQRMAEVYASLKADGPGTRTLNVIDERQNSALLQSEDPRYAVAEAYCAVVQALETKGSPREVHANGLQHIHYDLKRFSHLPHPSVALSEAA